MKRYLFGGLQALFVLLFFTPFGLLAEETVRSQDGWQGPRPTPQQSVPFPPQQRPIRPRPQVLELSPAPQLQIPPQQQTTPSPALQKQRPRPSHFLTVTVTDARGRYVTGLTAEDFIVYEGEVSQPVTSFRTGQHEPASLGILVDMSESMLTKRNRARDALLSFIKSIKRGDEVFLQSFNRQPQLLQDFTDSRPLLMQATAQLRPNDKTALYDAILDGLRRVKRGRHGKKALIVISDGLDTASRSSLDETLKAVRESAVLVYTIGIGSLKDDARRTVRRFSGRPFIGARGLLTIEAVDVELLQTISNSTGAKHFFLDTTEVLGSGAALDRATQTIAYELRQQYSVGYLSPLKGDVYRDVRVETRKKGFIIRTQKNSGG